MGGISQHVHPGQFGKLTILRIPLEQLSPRPGTTHVPDSSLESPRLSAWGVIRRYPLSAQSLLCNIMERRQTYGSPDIPISSNCGTFLFLPEVLQFLGSTLLYNYRKSTLIYCGNKTSWEAFDGVTSLVMDIIVLEDLKKSFIRNRLGHSNNLIMVSIRSSDSW